MQDTQRHDTLPSPPKLAEEAPAPAWTNKLAKGWLTPSLTDAMLQGLQGVVSGNSQYPERPAWAFHPCN